MRTKSRYIATTKPWNESKRRGEATKAVNREVSADEPALGTVRNELWLNQTRSVWTAPVSAAVSGGRKSRQKACVLACDKSGAKVTALLTLLASQRPV
jgi:hypothetical protein